MKLFHLLAQSADHFSSFADLGGQIVMLRSLSFTTAPATLTAYEAAWQARAAVRCNPQLSCAREQLKLVFKELV